MTEDQLKRLEKAIKDIPSHSDPWTWAIATMLFGHLMHWWRF